MAFLRRLGRYIVSPPMAPCSRGSMHSEQFRLHGQERIVQVDKVHPFIPARGPEMPRSTGVSSVELLLPSFQSAPSSREGSWAPTRCFSVV